MNRRLGIAAGMILLAAVSIRPAPSRHRGFLFREGNRLYQEGLYEQAAAAYREILETGYAGAELYYNMGNACYKNGETARAILFYERALRLNPRDEDTRFNLQVARLSTVDRIPALPEMFHQTWLRRWREIFGAVALNALTGAVYLLFIAALIFRLSTGNTALRRRLRTLALGLGIGLAVLSLTWVSRVHDIQSRNEAVVMAPAVDVSSAPEEDGTVIFTIHAGLKIRVLRRRGEWSEIRLSDGKEGWLRAETLEII